MTTLPRPDHHLQISDKNTRVLRSIPTPWVPYAVAFSRDGLRVAIGGGSFYGDGGIVLADLSSGNEELFQYRRELRPHEEYFVPTASGLSFSEDDRHVAVSNWTGRHHYAPTFLFDVSGVKLTHRATLERKIRGCPTGVLLSGRHTVTRNHRAAPSEVIAVFDSPQQLAIRAENITQHLTNCHLVVVGGNVITAGRGLPPGRTLEDEGPTFWSNLRNRFGFRSELRQSRNVVEEGLVSVPLGGNGLNHQLIPVHACRQITAIAATPDGHGFVTGGLDGELDTWSWSGQWQQERVRGRTINRELKFPNLRWVTYESNSVVGLCYLCSGLQWVTMTADGELGVMEGRTCVGSWQLSTSGSPRALAAHPANNRIAIGIKQNGYPSARGVVDIIEIEPPLGTL